LKVTLWFTAEVGDDDVTEVWAVALFTVCATVAEPVIAVTLKFESPAYVAITLSAGYMRDEVVQVAWPLAFSVWVGQSLLAAPLMVKLTVPVGTVGLIAVPVKLVVNVTDWSTVEVDGVEVIASVAGSLVTVSGSVTGLLLTVKLSSPE